MYGKTVGIYLTNEAKRKKKRNIVLENLIVSWCCSKYWYGYRRALRSDCCGNRYEHCGILDNNV